MSKPLLLVGAVAFALSGVGLEVRADYFTSGAPAFLQVPAGTAAPQVFGPSDRAFVIAGNADQNLVLAGHRSKLRVQEYDPGAGYLGPTSYHDAFLVDANAGTGLVGIRVGVIDPFAANGTDPDVGFRRDGSGLLAISDGTAYGYGDVIADRSTFNSVTTDAIVLGYTIQSVSADTTYDVASGVSVVVGSVSGTSKTLTVRLPYAASHAGRMICVIAKSIAATCAVTITSQGGQVNGGSSLSLTALGDKLLFSDGVDWETLN